MRTRAAVLSSAVVVSVVGVLAFAAPANAVTTHDTIVTVAIAQGEIGITAPADPALTSVPATAAGTTVTIALGEIAVSDLSGGTGWTVGAAATPFTGADAGGVLGSVAYPAVVAATVGSAVVTGSALAALTEVPVAVQDAAATGANSATWSPTLTLTIPAGAQVDSYTSTITHSLI